MVRERRGSELDPGRSIPAKADYSRLFLTRSGVKEIRQSTLSIQDILDGLDPADHRLHHEIIALLRGN
jgi:hypothetical protein